MIAGDVEVRRDICRACRRACDVRETIEAANPCAACPLGVWHQHADCGHDEAPVMVAAPAIIRRVRTAADLFARRVRAYSARGLLVPAAERHHRRDTCAGCPAALPTGHRGLYRCGDKSCGCGGGDELRMAMPATTCLKWLRSDPGEAREEVLR